jgi:hypothetical protein
MQRIVSKVGTVTDANEKKLCAWWNDKDLWDGGHLKKAEIYSGVILILLRHKQCRKCNRFLGGNELMFRLIQRWLNIAGKYRDSPPATIHNTVYLKNTSQKCPTKPNKLRN